jgi:hypothetical protein
MDFSNLLPPFSGYKTDSILKKKSVGTSETLISIDPDNRILDFLTSRRIYLSSRFAEKAGHANYYQTTAHAATPLYQWLMLGQEDRRRREKPYLKSTC